MKCSIRNIQRCNNRLTDSPRLWWTHLNSWRCWVTLTFLCCLDLLFDLFFNGKVRSSIFSCLFFFFCHLCKRSQCFSLAWTEDQNSYYFQSPHFVHLPEETFLCSSAVNTQYSNLSLLTPKETIFIFTETVIFFFLCKIVNFSDAKRCFYLKLQKDCYTLISQNWAKTVFRWLS